MQIWITQVDPIQVLGFYGQRQKAIVQAINFSGHKLHLIQTEIAYIINLTIQLMAHCVTTPIDFLTHRAILVINPSHRVMELR